MNPSKPAYQLIGVYNLEIARLYNYLLQNQDTKFAIIHSLDGYDEISLTSDVKVITPKGEKIYSPYDLAGKLIDPKEIEGGEKVEDAVKVFLSIIDGNGTEAQNAVVCSNAAMGLMLTDSYPDYQSAFDAAKDSLLGGKAKNALKKLLSLQ